MANRSGSKKLPDVITEKRCPKCMITKLVSEFFKDSSKKHGIDTYCKVCKPKLRKQKQKEYYCKHYFGFDINVYNKLYSDKFEFQKGHCYLCNNVITPLRLDHDHSTGQVRMLLCERCNLFVGQIENHMNLTKKIFKYLELFDGSVDINIPESL